MLTIPMLILVIANTTTTVRLVTFDRGCAKFKREYSFIAAVVCAVAVAQVVRVLVDFEHTSNWEAFLSVIFASLVVQAKGNIACLFNRIGGSDKMETIFKAIGTILRAIFGGKVAEAEPEPDLPKIAWGAKVSLAFKEKALRITESLGFPVDYLMSVIAFETARTFRPDIKNPGSSATGLIQFMAATAKDLGTSTKDLAKMSAEEQLDWVYAYFKPYKGRIKTLYDVYMAVLLPKAIGKPNSFVLWTQGSAAYKANSGLDRDKKGYITKGDAAEFMDEYLKEGRTQWLG